MRHVEFGPESGSGLARDVQVAAERPGEVLPPTLEVRDYARVAPAVRASSRWMRTYTALVVASDFLVAVGVAILTLTIFSRTDHPFSTSVVLVGVFALSWVAALGVGRTYEHRFVGGGSEEYRRLFHSAVIFVAVMGTTLYALAYEPAGRRAVAGALVLVTLGSLFTHWSARQVLHGQWRRGRAVHRVVVVGMERSVAELVRTLRREPHAGLVVVGACVDHPRGVEVEDVPVLGTSDHVVDVLRECQADVVAVTAWSDVSQTDLRRLSWDLEGSGVTLLVAPRLADVSGPRIHIRPVAGLPLLNVEEPEFSGVRRLVKGGMDRLLALLACVVLSPALLAIAVAVKVSSPGPVIFRQVRIGRQGRPFTIHKFRTMYCDAEERLIDLRDSNESDGPLFKMKDDPRVTKVGGFLRRYSLDELPQFFDVLVGRMSLVGPRPPLPHEVSGYPGEVRRRLIVKPGITGLWQVSGRSDLAWDDAVRLDLSYVENWSLALDVAILLKTAVAVLRRQGAY